MSNWNQGMSEAYLAGVEDGKQGKPPDVSKANGFTACYLQGYQHGQKQVKQ